jgi:hypothetical protein
MRRCFSSRSPSWRPHRFPAPYPRAAGDRRPSSAREKKPQKQERDESGATTRPRCRRCATPALPVRQDAVRRRPLRRVQDGREGLARGFSGEIQGISAGCEYKDDKPIEVTMQVLFELGKGPQAAGRQKTYSYWVAVTDRNRAVLAKQDVRACR